MNGCAAKTALPPFRCNKNQANRWPWRRDRALQRCRSPLADASSPSIFSKSYRDAELWILLVPASVTKFIIVPHSYSSRWHELSRLQNMTSWVKARRSSPSRQAPESQLSPNASPVIGGRARSAVSEAFSLHLFVIFVEKELFQPKPCRQT